MLVAGGLLLAYSRSEPGVFYFGKEIAMSRRSFKLLAAIVLLALAGLSCRMLSGSPKVEDLRLAADEQGEQPTTSFPQNGTFYLVGNMGGLLLDEATVKVTWTGVQLANGDSDVKIEEKEQQVPNGDFWFSLFKTEGKWPAGDYKVDVAVNDEIVETLTFQVEPDPASISNLQMAKDQEGQQPSTSFDPPDAFYVTFDLENPRPETTIKAVWKAVEVEGSEPDAVIKEQEESGFDTSGGYYLQLSRTDGIWTPGKYKVEIALDGQPAGDLAFEVVAPPVPVGGQLIEPYLAEDEAGQLAAAAFSQASEFYAHFQAVDVPPEGLAIKGILKTLAAEGETPGTEVGTAEGVIEGGPNFVRFYSARPWPLGTYQIELYANDQLVYTLDLEVIGTNTSGAQVSEVYASADEAGSQRTEIFSASSPIYIQTTMANSPDDTEIKAVLVAAEVQGEEPYTYVTEVVERFGSGPIYFTFTSQSGWPAGRYVVYLYLNGQLAQMVVFSVQ